MNYVCKYIFQLKSLNICFRFKTLINQLINNYKT